KNKNYFNPHTRIKVDKIITEIQPYIYGKEPGNSGRRINPNPQYNLVYEDIKGLITFFEFHLNRCSDKSELNKLNRLINSLKEVEHFELAKIQPLT
ncbi:MAG: hypothetical protein AAFO82_06460, partial [Bacteroidota bacterium]